MISKNLINSPTLNFKQYTMNPLNQKRVAHIKFQGAIFQVPMKENIFSFYNRVHYIVNVLSANIRL